MYIRGVRPITLLGLVLMLVCTAASGQEGTTRQSDGLSGWSFEVTPFYLWLPALDGDLTVRGQTASVDASVGDVIESLVNDLRFAITGHVEARRKDLVVFIDLLFLSLEDEEATPLRTQTEVEFQELIFEFGAGYRLGRWSWDTPAHPTLTLDVLGGGRYVYLDTELEIEGTGPLGLGIEVDKSVDWIDPFIGARLRLDLAKKWTLMLRGDIGGFDIGSDFTWNLVGTVQYRVSRRVTLVAGYRVLDIDYDQGSGTDRFVFDMQMRGPGFGVTLDF